MYGVEDCTPDAPGQSLRTALGRLHSHGDDTDDLRRRIRQGMRGEGEVATKLTTLVDDGWYVRHGLMRPEGGDIDHLLVRGHLVLVVNTKDIQARTLHIDLDHVDLEQTATSHHHSQARAQAAYLRDRLEASRYGLTVVPMVVYHRLDLHEQSHPTYGRQPRDIVFTTSLSVRQRISDLVREYRAVADPRRTPLAVLREFCSWWPHGCSRVAEEFGATPTTSSAS